jgi:beta-lactamase class A
MDGQRLRIGRLSDRCAQPTARMPGYGNLRFQGGSAAEENLTGLDRLRANLPTGWRAADKTGANGEHTSNDMAVLWPPGRPPVVVTAYITQCRGPEDKRAAMLADIGRLVREVLRSSL